MYVVYNCSLDSPASILFYISDRDFSGTMNKREMTKMLRKLDCDEESDVVEAIFEERDIGDDITYEEFMEIIDEIID